MDERAGAYRALGQTKVTGQPGVLVCTSGTAILNYAPAIGEAFKSQTPLIILSADRPSESVLANSNQTLPQTNLLGPILKSSSVAVKLILACPCLPVFDVDTSATLQG